MGCHRCTKLCFCLWTCLPHLHWYEEEEFCTFQWALSCHHYLHIFNTSMYLFFDNFLLLVLQLLLIQQGGYWKNFILLHQTPVLPILFLYHHAVCCELLCIVLFCHLFTHLHAMASAYSLKVIHSPAPWTAPAIGWIPSWLICAPAVFTIVMHFFSVCGIVLLLMLFMALNSLLSFIASINTFKAFCALTLITPG